MRAIAFDQDAPQGISRAVIRRDATDGKPELLEMRWGLRPNHPGDAPRRFIRSEGRTFPTNRCLLPASDFQVVRAGRRYCFSLEDGNWFYLAGIWRAADASWPASFAILTVEANQELSRYQNRQGALVRRNRHLQWLNLTVPEEDVLTTPPARSFMVEEIVGGFPQLEFQL